MSIDPETLRQIEELSHDDRPLLVLDVDDVILEFIRPFPKYLEQHGFRLQLGEFRLQGNVFHLDNGAAAEKERVRELLTNFFDGQSAWQTVTDGAAEAIETIAKDAEVVLLTAMPHRHRETRRRHLDDLGLTYPLLTTEMAKGPAIMRLRGDVARPVAFVDDMPHNLVSAHEYVPEAHLFHLMADNELRKFLPPVTDGVTVVDDWHDAKPRIAAALGL
jgi:hypothetical protein